MVKKNMSYTTFSQTNLNSKPLSLKQETHKPWMYLLLLILGLIGLISFFFLLNNQVKKEYKVKQQVSSIHNNILAISNEYSSVIYSSSYDRLKYSYKNIDNAEKIKNNIHEGVYNISSLDKGIKEQYSQWIKNYNPLVLHISDIKEFQNHSLSAIDSLRVIQSDINKISKVKQFNISPWNNALNPVLDNLNNKNISLLSSSIFQFNKDSVSSLNKWLKDSKEKISILKKLNNFAQQSLAMPQQNKDLLASLEKNFISLSKDINYLVINQKIMLSLNSSYTLLGEQNIIFEHKLTSFLSNMVQQIHSTTSIYKYGIGVSIILALCGLIFLIKEIILLKQGIKNNNKNAQSSRVLSKNVYGITKQLRKIILLESNNKQIKYNEDSDLSFLSSLINKTLEQRNNGTEIMKSNGFKIYNYLLNSETILSEFFTSQVEQKKTTGALQLNILHFSDNLLHILDKIKDSQNIINEEIHFIKSNIQENNSGIDLLNKVREEYQNSSKLIKRLGESSQNIVPLNNYIKNINNQVKVLALNMAVEANDQNEGSKKFTILAQELERLTKNTENASKDVFLQIESIQDDVRKSLLSVEKSSDYIIQVHNKEKASLSFLTQCHTQLEKISKSILTIHNDTQDIQNGLHKEGVFVKDVLSNMNIQDERMYALNENHQKIKDLVEQFKIWLNNLNIKWED